VKRKIREYAPFIILGYSFVFAVFSHFDFYFDFYRFLPDLLGFSVFTNLFMYSVYMNKKYCTATKFCVLGLIALNIFNLVYEIFGISGAIYDIYLLTIVCLVLMIKKVL